MPGAVGTLPPCSTLTENFEDEKLKFLVSWNMDAHSSHAYFRMRLLLGAAMVTEDESESDELVLLKFHSNARIISAQCIINDVDDDVTRFGEK